MEPNDTLAQMTAPVGSWDVLYEDVDVVGERFRLDACAEFIAAATACMNAGRDFGVRLERDPANAHDPFAVKVFGFWLVPKMFTSRREERHLGFLPAKMAYRLGQNDIDWSEIGACLRAIQFDDGEPNIVLHVLQAD